MLIREEIVTQVGWYKEEWATPYMAAVARVVFKPTIGVFTLSDPRLGLRKPEVTLTPQPTPQRISAFSGIMSKIFGKPDVTLTPQPGEERITALGAEGEWFKKNRILVIVVIVALVLLFFFLKKRRR